MTPSLMRLVACLCALSRLCGGVALTTSVQLNAAQEPEPGAVAEAQQRRLEGMLEAAADAAAKEGQTGPEFLRAMRELRVAMGFGEQEVSLKAPPTKVDGGVQSQSMFRDVVKCTAEDVHNFDLQVESERTLLNETITHMSAKGADMMSIMKKGIRLVFGKDCKWTNFWNPSQMPWQKFNGCMERQYNISQPCASCFTTFGEVFLGAGLQNPGCMFACAPIFACDFATRKSVDVCMALEHTCWECARPAAHTMVDCFNSTDRLHLSGVVDTLEAVLANGTAADAVWNGTVRSLMHNIFRREDGTIPNHVPLDVTD